MSTFRRGVASPSTWVIAALAVGYGLYNQLQAPQAPDHSGSQSALLANATNPQFVAFVVVTAAVLAVPAGMSERLLSSRLLRLGSFRKAVLEGCCRSTGRYLLLVCVVTLCWLSISFASPSDTRAPDQHRIASLGLFLGQIVLLGTFVLTVEIILTTVRIVIARPWVDLTLAGTLWLWSALSSFGTFEPGSLADAGSFLNVELFVDGPRPAVGVICSLGLVSAVCWTALRLRDRGETLRDVVPSEWLATGLLLVAVIAITAAASHDGGPAELLMSLAPGRSGPIVGFLTTVAVTLAFVVSQHARSPRAPEYPLEESLLRYGSTARWFCRWMLRVTASAVAYRVGVMCAVAAASFMIGDQTLRLTDAFWPKIVAQFIGLGVVEAVFFCSLSLLASWFTASSLAPPLVVAILIATWWLQDPLRVWLPVGLSAVDPSAPWSRIGLAAVSLSTASTVTAACCLLLFRRRPVGV